MSTFFNQLNQDWGKRADLTSWDQLYLEINPKDIAFDLLVSKEFRGMMGDNDNSRNWRNLALELTKNKIDIPNFVSLGSGPTPWFRLYLSLVVLLTKGLNLTELNLQSCTLVDLAYKNQEFELWLSNAIDSRISAERESLLLNGLYLPDIKVKLESVDALNTAPLLDKFESNSVYLEIHSLLSYIDWGMFKQLFLDHYLKKVSVIIVSQDNNPILSQFHSPNKIPGNNALQEFFIENGYILYASYPNISDLSVTGRLFDREMCGIYIKNF